MNILASADALVFRRWVAILAAVFCVCAAPAWGEVTIERVDVGLGGRFKLGRWTPVRVMLTAEQAVDVHVEVVAPDGEGTPTRFGPNDAQPIAVRSGEPATVVIYALIGRAQAALQVEVRSDDASSILARRTTPLAPAAVLATQQLIVSVAGAMGVEDALGTRHTRPTEQRVAASVAAVHDLPADWFGYDGVDLLVIATSDAAALDAWTSQQVQAVARWVRSGGRLVVCLGAQAPAALERPGRLAALAAGTLDRVTSLRDAPQLAAYANTTEPLAAVADTTGRPIELPLAVFRDVDGQVVVSEMLSGRPTPLIVTRREGFGRLAVVAADLDTPPLSQWRGRGLLVARLLDDVLGAPSEPVEQRGAAPAAHLGFDDLAGQLRAALDRFSTVPVVPFSLVVALMIAYVALIGPIDYFVLRKCRVAPVWTWLTFPLIVIGVAVLAVWMVGRFKSDRLLVRQVDVIDVDAQGRLARGSTWAHVYSPRAAACDVRLTIDDRSLLSDAPDVLLGWHGLAGSALGGMNSATAATAPGQPYRIVAGHDGASAAPRGMPIAPHATRSVFGRWLARSAHLDLGRLTASGNRTLRGQLHNPLPVDLADCRLIYRDWIYEWDRLGAGQGGAIEQLASPKGLEWTLLRGEVVESQRVNTPWDRHGRDVPRIVEMMMFHQAARGRVYTGLLHRQHRELDLSDLLSDDVAMLVGRAADASTLSLGDACADGEYDRRWTLFRFLIPVAHESNERD